VRSSAVITKEQAIVIHDAAIDRFGGIAGVRDEGMLDSALAQSYQTFGGSDLYEGDIAKACRLCFGVVADHPFADGNKRTGAALLGTCLRLTGHTFEPPHDEFLRTMLGIADGSVSYEQLVEWVKSVAG